MLKFINLLMLSGLLFSTTALIADNTPAKSKQLHSKTAACEQQATEKGLVGAAKTSYMKRCTAN